MNTLLDRNLKEVAHSIEKADDNITELILKST